MPHKNTPTELSDEALGAVAGGTALDTLAEIGSDDASSLQGLLDKQTQSTQTRSTVLKKDADTKSSVIAKIG
jgi:hypothetical protein